MVARKHTQTFCSDLTNFKQNSTLLEAKYGKSEVLSHPTACTPPAVALPKWGGYIWSPDQSCQTFWGVVRAVQEGLVGYPPPPTRSTPHPWGCGDSAKPWGTVFGVSHWGGGQPDNVNHVIEYEKSAIRAITNSDGGRLGTR